MSASRDKGAALLSVLDRLLDDDPEHRQEMPPSANEVHVKVREAIRRDVEAFLNTRRRCLPIADELRDLSHSLLDYGVPDLIGRNLSSTRRRQQFLRDLESSLRAHDRRFKTIKISATGNPQSLQRLLHFRIDALLHAEPAPETMIFDSRIEPVSKAIEVKG